MPRYDPPYLKRPLVNPAAAAAAAAAGQMGGPKPIGNNSSGGAGPSGLAGPSGSGQQQHGPPMANHNPSSSTPISSDAMSLEAGAKGISFGNNANFK